MVISKFQDILGFYQKIDNDCAKYDYPPSKNEREDQVQEYFTFTSDQRSYPT